MKLKSCAHQINKQLKKIPGFRNFLVYTYHYSRKAIFGISRIINGYETGFLKSGKRITPQNKNCYFGYYDKCPFSSDGSHYLFIMVNGKKSPQVGEKAKVCYAQSAEKYEVVGETLAWNSQQGAMLRFINDMMLAWNDYDVENDRYVTVLFDVVTREKEYVDVPLYDISDDGKKGITLDFERLNVDAEGYGYIQQQRKVFDKDTYIDIVDIESGKKKRIITLEKLVEKYPIPTDAEFGYFNHLEFNPDGTRFNFIFRYVVDQKRISRLFTADIEGENIHLLADDEMVSHCTWKDSTHISLWCRLSGRNDYYTIEDTEVAQFEKIGMNTPKEDGHPTYNAERTKIITDTYPDKAEYRHLVVYDCISDTSTDIARLYAPVLLHGPLRCDFHPRWHPNMRQVVIDSAHEGFRGMYLVDIE